MRFLKWIVVVTAILLSCAQQAQGQTTKEPGKQGHWGITAGFSTWETPNSLEVIFDAGRINGIKGQDIEIGAAHGSTLGGNTRFLYVRKKLNPDGVIVRDLGGFCFQGNCVETGGYFSTDNAWFDGFEVDKVFSFYTLKERVQFGMMVGGGVGFTKGTTKVKVISARLVNNQIVRTESSGGEGPASALIAGGLDYFPLLKFGPTVGLILAPGLKLQVGGGLNFPGTSKVDVVVVYLIGAKK